MRYDIKYDWNNQISSDACEKYSEEKKIEFVDHKESANKTLHLWNIFTRSVL